MEAPCYLSGAATIRQNVTSVESHVTIKAGKRYRMIATCDMEIRLGATMGTGNGTTVAAKCPEPVAFVDPSKHIGDDCELYAKSAAGVTGYLELASLEG